jgi:hypothetical protein
MGTTNTLFARTMLNGIEQTVSLGGADIGGAHTFRVSWQPSGIQYFIDDALVASNATAIGALMSVHVSEFTPGGPVLAADWVRVDRYPTSPGTFISSRIDLGVTQAFDTLTWGATTPAGTGVSLQTRTSADGTTWSAWSAPIASSGGAITSAAARYFQYQATLTSTGPTLTPSVESVTVNYHSASGDSTPPVISAIQASADNTSALITWTTDEASTSRVDYGTGTGYGQSKSDAALTSAHSVTITGLSPITTYHFKVTSVDASANSASSGDQQVATTGNATQTTATDFTAGTVTSTGVTEDAGGEVRLAAPLNDLFDGSSLGGGWVQTPWSGGGTVSVGGGVVTVDGVRVSSGTTFGPGSAMEARATFPAAGFTHLGVGTDLDGTANSDWAIFSTGVTTDTLFARTMLNGVDSAISLGTGFVGSAHTYRIAWDAAGVQFFIDGAVVASNTTSITVPMSAQISEFNVGAPSLTVDWYRAGPYATSGTFVSSAIDAGQNASFGTLAWTSSLPAGGSVSLETRTSADSQTWSSWSPVASSGDAITSPAGRYAQYRATFSSTDAAITPVLQDVTLTFAAAGGGGTPTPTPTPTSTPTPTPTATPTPSPPPSTWWNANYTARQKLTVQVGANAPFNGYSGYSVAARVNTAALVSSGRLRSDCNDLRVVQSSGGIFTELDRQVIGCNTATTDVWFMLRADIAANASDASYALYFSNPAAGAPPANRANVYLHADDWSSDDLASYNIGRQDNWQGTGTYNGFTYDAANQRVAFDTGDNRSGGLRLTSLNERDVYVEQTVRYTGCYAPDVSQGLLARYSGNGSSSSRYYALSQSNSSGCQNNPYTSPAIVKGSRTGTVCGSGAGTAWALDGASHRMGFAVWGSGTVSLKGWLDAASIKPATAPTLSCTNSSSPINGAGDVVWLQAQTAGSFDDFLVRRYTEPEPALNAAALEVGP